MEFPRITVDPERMGGVPCIRELRIPVATVVDMVADGMSPDEIVVAYPDLESEDVEEALRYAAETLRQRPATVSLEDIVDRMEMQTAESSHYLNRRTGEFVFVGEEDFYAIRHDRDDEELPEWQRDHMPEVRQALESDDYIELPTQFDVHEWSIMERFCRSLEPGQLRDELDDAVHGRGAFRMFKDAIHRHGIADDWYAYRNAELEEIAISWLQVNEIPYRRG